MEATARGLGGLDVLVNNAGTQLRGLAVDIDWDDWDRLMAVNLKGQYFMATRFARWCIAQGRPGAVVSTASTHGFTGIANQSVYGISKGGVIQMTRMLAIEWAEHGIRVNAVAPATVLTPRAPRRWPIRRGGRRCWTACRPAASRRPRRSPRRSASWPIPRMPPSPGHILPVDGGLLAV